MIFIPLSCWFLTIKINVFLESGVSKHLLGGDALPKKVNYVSFNLIQYKK